MEADIEIFVEDIFNFDTKNDQLFLRFKYALYSEYPPEYENIKCKGEEGIYPCKNKIKVIDLLTHRSGYTYYSDVYGENKFISPPSPLNKFTSSYHFDNLDDFSKAVANHPLEFEPGGILYLWAKSSNFRKIGRGSFRNFFL